MNNDLKLIVKILEHSTKSILSNITTGTSHKESKSSTTTNTMNETITCIGENDKNEQKQEQNTETKTNQFKGALSGLRQFLETKAL